MRKTSLMLALVVASIAVNAQSKSFKPFKVDFATGYAIPGGSGAKGGVLFAIEPKYALNDNIAVGIRFEGAVMARASIDQSGQLSSGDVKASGSYLATGDYYFNTNKLRPFAGIGAGSSTSGYVNGAAASARFNGPGNIIVSADLFSYLSIPLLGYFESIQNNLQDLFDLHP